MRKKSERVLKLLEKGPVLKEERDRARRITRGIQGFGSFNLSWSSTNDNGMERASNCYGRSHSHYEDYSQQEDTVPDSQKEKLKNSEAWFDSHMNKKTESGERPKDENLADKNKSLPVREKATIDAIEGLPPRESKPVLTCQEGTKNEFQREDHPFNELEYRGMESRLLLSQN